MWAGGGRGDQIRRYLDSFGVTVTMAQVPTFTLWRARGFFTCLYNLSLLFLQFFSVLALWS